VKRLREIETPADALDEIKHVARALDPGSDPYDLYTVNRALAFKLHKAHKVLAEALDGNLRLSGPERNEEG
jgi:hypothetical protein